MRQPLRDQPHQRSRQNKQKYDQRRHQEHGQRIEDDLIGWLERKGQRTQSEYARQQKHDGQKTGAKENLGFAAAAHATLPESESATGASALTLDSGELAGSKGRSGQSSHRGALLRHQFLPVFTISA